LVADLVEHRVDRTRDLHVDRHLQPGRQRVEREAERRHPLVVGEAEAADLVLGERPHRREVARGAAQCAVVHEHGLGVACQAHVDLDRIGAERRCARDALEAVLGRVVRAGPVRDDEGHGRHRAPRQVP